MRMMNKTQDIVPRNIINSTWYHSSLGVTTSKIMPLDGGLCHIQRTSTLWANMICPSLEDFVTYNGLWPAGPTWFAPHLRTLLRTMDFGPLGQHDSPLIGGLCHVQWTSACWISMICPSLEDFVSYNGFWPAGSQWSHNKIEHQQTNQWHIKSGTKNDAKQVPKDQLLLVDQGSDCHTVRWKWSIYLNGLKILGGRFSLWSTKQ